MHMLQRIFDGEYTPASIMVLFLIAMVIKLVFVVFLGPVAIYPNLVISCILGFGMVRSALEHNESNIFMRGLCALLAFSQLGTLAFARI